MTIHTALNRQFAFDFSVPQISRAESLRQARAILEAAPVPECGALPAMRFPGAPDAQECPVALAGGAQIERNEGTTCKTIPEPQNAATALKTGYEAKQKRKYHWEWNHDQWKPVEER